MFYQDLIPQLRTLQRVHTHPINFCAGIQRLQKVRIPIASNITMISHCIQRRTRTAEIRWAGRNESMCIGDVNVLRRRVERLTLGILRNRTDKCSADGDSEYEQHFWDVGLASMNIRTWIKWGILIYHSSQKPKATLS